MALTVFLAEAGLLDLSLSFVAELIVFILMIAILGRWAYPWIIQQAEARQKQVAAELEAAEKQRQESEQRLKDAQRQLDEARSQAAQIIEGANKSGEQLRAELREKADEEAKRMVEHARQEVEAERAKAIQSVRAEVADLVVVATEKVVGETLDEDRHRKLIDQAIAEVEKEGLTSGDGRR